MEVQKVKENSEGTPIVSKIVTYRLEYMQLEILKETTNNKKINGQNIIIYEAQSFEDILNNKYFMAFLNFSHIKAEEKELFLTFIKEGMEKEKLKNKDKNSSLNIPLTFILNVDKNSIKKQPYLYTDSDILDHKERLRLTLLEKVMEVEGKRPARMSGEMPPRTVRVMVMHRHLVTYGWISKDKCDRLCKALGYEVISDRSFHRDINLIRYIEHVYDEEIIYDEGTRRYVLKNYVKICD